MGAAGEKKRKTHSCLHMGRLSYGALPTRAVHWELTAVSPVVQVSSMQGFLSPLALASRVGRDSGIDTTHTNTQTDRQTEDSFTTTLQTVDVESESDWTAANRFYASVLIMFD